VVIGKLVVPEGGEKGIDSCLGKFALVPVSRFFRPRIVHSKAIEKDEQHHRHKMQQAMFEPGPGNKALIKISPSLKNIDDDQCDEQYPRDQIGQGIGLVDIVDHLKGINQVVYGNKVEPALEFLPKGKFGKEREYGNHDHHRHDEIAADVIEIGLHQPLWQQKKVGRIENYQEQRNPKIIDKALCKYTGQCQWRKLRLVHRKVQYQAHDKGCHQKKEHKRMQHGIPAP